MQKSATTIDNNTVYIGMDVHKESFTLCAYKIEMPEPGYTIRITADYKQILNYLERMRGIFGDNTKFVCGYEAGCLGYSLYRDLMHCGIQCVILAPNTMLHTNGKRLKTDSRDAHLIAQCLAYHTYSAVYVPDKYDIQVKEFIRMRNDHKNQLKAIKQQILSFCLRHNLRCTLNCSHWTRRHLEWLRSLKLEPMLQEVLDEYMITFENLQSKIERQDERIEEIARSERYAEKVHKLECFLGVKTYTALATIVEIGDFEHFPNAGKFAANIGLVPGEHSSGDKQIRTGITKAGNVLLRKLYIETAHSYSRGKIGYKSKALRARQAGNTPEFIAYADKTNERLRRRYYKMQAQGKHGNVIKTAIARELACFIWGAMTNHIA